MKSPQKENGYTGIANELLEAMIKLPLSGYDLRIILAIARFTYGFSKKEDTISLSQISKITGIRRPHISRTIKALLPTMVIAVTNNGNRLPLSYRINKDYDSWKPKTVTKDGNNIVTKDGNIQRKKEIYTKDADFHYQKKVPLPAGFYLTEKMIAYIEKQGCKDSKHHDSIFEDFCNYQTKAGKKWIDWTRAFYDWVRTDKKKYNRDKYKTKVYIT